MKEIPLTQGKVALIDDEDFEYLNRWKWHAAKHGNTYYAKRSSNHKTIFMHREILNPFKGLVTDHKNRIGIDNQRHNLRVVTNRENGQNRRDGKVLVGVDKSNQKFRARIRIGGKYHDLGSFPTPEQAHAAYMKAASILIEKEKQQCYSR